MCTDVWVISKQVNCETKGQLREALGIDPIAEGGLPDADWPDNSCLCPLDAEATAKAAGMVIQEHDLEWVYTVFAPA